MRLRNESLRTGQLLTDREQHRSALFLVAGTEDIQTLVEIDRACAKYWTNQLEWHDVADHALLPQADPQLEAGRVARFEVHEFAGIEPELLDDLLQDLVARLSRAEPELFPHAGGAVGAPARGIQFLDREHEVDEIGALVRAGEDVQLLAPRRSGKSSLLHKLETALSEYVPVYWDLERHDTPEHSAARIKVLAKPEVGFRSALEQTRAGWDALVRSSLEEIATPGKSILLLIDELVFLLDGLWKAQHEGQSRADILSYLSTLAEAFDGLDLRIVLAGSDSFLDYLRERGIDRSDVPPRFRELRPYYLPGLASRKPSLELRRLLLGTGLVTEPPELEWLLEHVDLTVPFPALRFLDGLASTLRTRSSLDRSALEEALNRFLDETDAFRDFERHLSREDDQIAGGSTAAAAALDRIARTTKGASTAEVEQSLEAVDSSQRKPLLDWLLRTFPLAKQDDRVRFTSSIFRSWWLRSGRAG